jgi:WD40 repeat protein
VSKQTKGASVPHKMMIMGTSRGRVLAYSTREDTIPMQVTRIDADKGKGRSSVKLCSEGKYIFCVSALCESWSTVCVEDFKACVKGTIHDGTRECECKHTRAGIYQCNMCPVPLQRYTAMDVSSDGKQVATGDRDGAVVLWDALKGSVSQFLLAHTSRISSVSFAANGVQLLSTSVAGCLIIWDTATAARLYTIDDANAIDWAKFSPTVVGDFAVHKTYLDAVPVQSVVEMFRCDGQQEPTNLFVRVDVGPSFGTFSNNGLFIATRSKHGDRYNSVALLNTDSGVCRDLIYQRSDHVAAQKPTAIAFSPDSSQLAVSYIAYHFVLWCTRTAYIAKQLTTLELLHGDECITSLSWGRDYVREKNVIVSFAMGLHPRLGVHSPMMSLDTELMRMIINYM